MENGYATAEFQGLTRPLLEQQATPPTQPFAAQGDLLGSTMERMTDAIGVPGAMAAQSVVTMAAMANQARAFTHLAGLSILAVLADSVLLR